MIKMADINLCTTQGTTIYVDIDIFRFTKDKEILSTSVEMETNGEYEYIDSIKYEKINKVENHNDLKKVALNWIFKHVEITGN